MKGQMLKLFVVAAISLLIVAGCAAPPLPPPTPVPPTPTPTPDPAALVKAWVDAMNNGDVDAALALFTDDMKFDVFEYHARNKDELRGIFDWLAGLETKYQITECQTKEDRVVCTMPVSDACIAGYDPVGGLMTTMTFVPTQDGKIAQVNGYLDGFDDYYAKWISPAMTWMRANRAEELAKAESTSDGREAGAINAKLCKEYGESLKATPTPTPGPEDVARAYFDAVNRHDIDGILALFADEKLNHNVNDFFVVTTKNPLRNWYEYGLGLGSTFVPGDCKLQDDAVTCTAVYRDSCMDAGPVVYHTNMKFMFRDGKIATLYAPRPSEEAIAADQFLDQVTVWAAKNRPEEWTSFIADAEWAKFTDPSKPGTLTARQMGESISSICAAYRASQKAAPTATPVPPTPAPVSDLEKLAMAFQDAFNQGDFNGVLALFVDEGLSYFDGGFTARDKETLRREVLEYNSGLGGTVEFIDCAPKGEALRCTALWRNAHCLKAGCGLDVWHSELTVKPKDGKIQLMSFQDGSVTAEDQKACDQAYPKYEAWATANRPEEWKKLNVPVAFDLKGRPLGELASRVCKDYLDSQK